MFAHRRSLALLALLITGFQCRAAFAQQAGGQRVEWVGVVTLRRQFQLESTNAGTGSFTSMSTNEFTTFRIGPLKGVPVPEGIHGWQGPGRYTTTWTDKYFNQDEDGTFTSQSFATGSGSDNSDFGSIMSFDEPGSLKFTVQCDTAEQRVPRFDTSVKRKRDGSTEQYTSSSTYNPAQLSVDCTTDPKGRMSVGTRQVKEDEHTTCLYTWELHKIGTTPYEAVIIPPREFDSWIPKGGRDLAKPGDTVEVKVRAFLRNDPKTPKKAKFKFTLADVSREPGVCMNFPANEKDPKPDLKFEQSQNKKLRVLNDAEAETLTDESESSCVISCFDYGAWGRLRVTATIEGETEDAHIEGDPAMYELKLPIDEDGNHIADHWQNTNGTMGGDAKDDEDNLPEGNGVTGDGLTLYEEYRGFYCKGKHIRTSPTTKDLFIHNPDKLDCSLFTGAMNLDVHFVDAKEFDQERVNVNTNVINFNRNNATRGAQHLLVLKNARLPEGEYWESGPAGPPRSIDVIRVDRAQAQQFYRNRIKAIVARALARGCNIESHGTGDYIGHDLQLWRKFQDTWSPLGLSAPVGVKGGGGSGDLSCFMRDFRADFLEVPPVNIKIRWRKSEGSPWIQGAWAGMNAKSLGSRLCGSPKGVDNELGDAPRGNCAGQIQVNDTK